MIHDILRNQSFVDQDTFVQITRHYGYTDAACYRLSGKNLELIIGNQTESKHWPPAALFSSDYTPKKGAGFPIGWIKPPFNTETRKLWPKGISFYFPAQDWSSSRLVFAVKNAPGKRTKVGDLDGPLEALTANITSYIDQSELRHFISEAHINEQMEKMTRDLQILSDHEIRNPLTSVLGFGELLPTASPEELGIYSDTIIKETDKALKALSKINEVLHLNPEPKDDLENVLSKSELGDLSNQVAAQVRNEMEHICPGEQYNLSIRCPDDQDLVVLAKENMLKHALAEVLKNAMMYSSHGNVFMTLYRSERWLVVDIEDDGPGVSQGAEELIFLRFFQEPQERGLRKVKRGLGTGLYMARYITEQHGGTLKFIRGAGKHGIFRFLLPCAASEHEEEDLVSA